MPGKTISSDWYADQQLIITQISGDVTKQDVLHWEQTLYAALDRVADSGVFKIFINLHGFNAVNVDVHKYFRNIVPLTLARYGWKLATWRCFPRRPKRWSSPGPETSNASPRHIAIRMQQKWRNTNRCTAATPSTFSPTP
jgi:hypothetical protein